MKLIGIKLDQIIPGDYVIDKYVDSDPSIPELVYEITSFPCHRSGEIRYRINGLNWDSSDIIAIRITE